ncbi:MAG: KH domain-containing protein [Acaryochloridaceae cyanobacterium CSU_5_19]|nr:KH domain-containing protein [Acaryochloridaceae cyanobacterium CSU_5_19]
MSVPPAPQNNYVALVRFLIEPFLESADSLSVDCETNSRGRVWIRLAFAGADKGRVFGRGGRTIQAVRTLVEKAGQMADQSVSLEVFSEQQAKNASASRKTTSETLSSRTTQFE